MKKRIALVILFTLLMISMPSGIKIEKAQAWGLPVHMYFVEKATANLPDTNWKNAFLWYMSELKTGSTTPDQVYQDWANHLYYIPHTDNSTTADIAVNRWYNYVVNNFTQGNWKEGFFAAGVMSHYFTDINIPVHTGPYWDGHPAYEKDINNHLSEFEVTLEAPSLVTNITEFVIEHATMAHQYYDIIHEAYPNGDSAVLNTNSTIWNITETQMSRAINGLTSLWYTIIHNITAPELPEIEIKYTALIDNYHNNDYSESQLSSLSSQLPRWGIDVIMSNGPLTDTILSDDIDLLILTCPYSEINSTEQQAIANWLSGSNHSIILTSRGDYYNTSYARRDILNQILEKINSTIRVNDDSVYEQGTYRDWYVELEHIKPPQETLNITQGVDTFFMFSPSSIYYLSGSTATTVMSGDPTCYQLDQNPPPINTTYDTTKDSSGGDSIPLIGVEQVSTYKVAVAGTTFFSDFDFGKQEDFDNVVFLKNIFGWLLNTKLISADENTTTSTSTSTGTTSTGTNTNTGSDTTNMPYPIDPMVIQIGIISGVAILVIIVIIYKKRG